MDGSRKALHIAMIGFSLGTGRLPSAWMVGACVVAFLFNLLILNRLGGQKFMRQQDRARGFALGILMYPAILTLLYMIFWQTPIFALVGWCAMAFGDGFGGLIGRKFGQKTWAWSPAKSYIGTGAFWLLGSLATLLWLALFPKELFLTADWTTWFFIVLAVMAVSAWVESLPGLIDDNFSVPLVAALSAWLLFQLSNQPVPNNWPTNSLVALVLIAALMGAAVWARKISTSGSLVGGAIALGLWLGFSWLGLGALFLFFWAGSLASHFGKKQKATWGLDQENEGTRSIRHALANGGVAGLAGWLGWFVPEWNQVLAIVAIGALSAALADTFSSEFGVLYGKKFVHVLRFSSLKRGVDGAISLEGSLAGVAGALSMAGLWYLLQPQGLGWVLVGLAGIFGTWFDSVLGISLQKSGYMTNDTVNFANTAISGALFGFIASLI